MNKLIFSSVMMLLPALTMSAKINHPSLLFTPGKVSEAKARITTDSIHSQAWNRIKGVADENLAKNNIMKMEYLALAFQMTGDKKYSEKLRDMLLKISETKSWADAEMMQRDPAWRSELQMAHRAFQIAVAYDAIYNELSKSDRKKIAYGVYRLAVEPLLGDWL